VFKCLVVLRTLCLYFQGVCVSAGLGEQWGVAPLRHDGGRARRCPSTRCAAGLHTGTTRHVDLHWCSSFQMCSGRNVFTVLGCQWLWWKFCFDCYLHQSIRWLNFFCFTCSPVSDHFNGQTILVVCWNVTKGCIVLFFLSVFCRRQHFWHSFLMLLQKTKKAVVVSRIFSVNMLLCMYYVRLQKSIMTVITLLMWNHNSILKWLKKTALRISCKAFMCNNSVN